MNKSGVIVAVAILGVLLLGTDTTVTPPLWKWLIVGIAMACAAVYLWRTR